MISGQSITTITLYDYTTVLWLKIIIFFFQHDQNVYYRQPITLEFITFVFTIEYGSHCVRIILKYKIH